MLASRASPKNQAASYRLCAFPVPPTYICVCGGQACSHATRGMKGLFEGQVSVTEHEQRFGKTCTARGKTSGFSEPQQFRTGESGESVSAVYILWWLYL